ncbi:MAG: sulfurtransferase [Verrucomicrobiales bacterium]|nr:sulfurtransferase [Verrucomicrobiales bacterium]|tara:strand:- start:17809 stop:19578 length:1770 start_codon:yes stop_codon:yes gene_type:complete
MAEIVNIAAYKFVALDELETRRSELREHCSRLDLKGTILLAPEGINLFLAGTRVAIDEFLSSLRSDLVFADMEVKESPGDHRPFTRLLVRIKKEIIAFGVEGIDPVNRPAPRVSARELKAWLDEGKQVTLLDTRNDYEIALGTFEGAKAIGVDEFRQFPGAVDQLPAVTKGETIVTFCTGGIRCEKAAPYMRNAGFENVYQLDGGILKYFEECGGEHYQGDCFVFDQRVSVDSDLKETDTAQCFVCQAALGREDLASENYVPGKTCPHCWRSSRELMQGLLEERRIALEECIDPLPGSIPYENRRPMCVNARFDRASAIDFLVGMNTIHSREDWLDLCARGAVQMNGRPIGSDETLRAGMRLEHVAPATVEPDVNPKIEFLHEDEHIVVLSKPAPLPMHPCGRFNRNTFQFLLRAVYPNLKIRPAHRLDANTSGVAVCSKTRAVAAKLQPQFERGTVKKKYLALVHGVPASDEFESRAGISREPTAVGGRTIDPDGLDAHTKFRVITRSGDRSLIEALPLTGRTNQIRLHLWHSGHAIVGDPLYLPDGNMGEQQTLDVHAAPMCLHAAELEFIHPMSGERVSFQAPRIF